jgi:LysM repeat protein
MPLVVSIVMEMIVAGAILLLTIIPINSPIQSPKEIASPVPLTPSKTVSNTPDPSPTDKPSPTPKPKEEKIHEVKAGESMQSIAEEYYGSTVYWTTLWNDNQYIEDPRAIRAGMKLKIRDNKPEKAEELNSKLAKNFEAETSPTPTPTPASTQTPQPTGQVAGASTTVTPTPTPQAQERTQLPPGSFEQVYKDAGAKYGVPWEILYGLHHMETGGRDGAISSGYGTGAQGPLQFMPGTWATYGADGNGDGVNDINNAVDAIHGAANYLSKHGGVERGLKSYGGDSNLVYQYARSRGWSQ